MELKEVQFIFRRPVYEQEGKQYFKTKVVENNNQFIVMIFLLQTVLHNTQVTK